MHDSAQSLARYGRHGDNNLLHVSNSELRGIELLTGKKFTRNPDTGLPEAFNFGKVLGVAAPILAGIGTTALTGSPVAGAAAAGAVSGGVAKAQGASTEQALAQGLMSGITSYAGGQILSGVGEPAAQAVAPQLNAMGAGYTGAESVPQAAGYAGAVGPASVPAGQAASGVNLNTITGAASGATPEQAAARLMEQRAATQAAGPSIIQPGGAPTAAPSFMDKLSTQAGNFGDRVSNVISDPGAAMSKIGENIQAKPFSALMSGAGLYSTATDLMANQRPNIPGQTPYDPGRYPEAFPAVPRTWNAPPVGYIPGQGPEYRYFAKGGLATMRSSDNAIKNVVDEAKAAILGEHPRPKEALARLEETFGPGSTALLRERIGGGRVSGAGGGMDDLVPGSIEGRQKVRLADGEFVVPADVVSGLGDGSTDQGVRRLHGMMDKVRKERTGKEAQPKSIGGKITL